MSEETLRCPKCDEPMTFDGIGYVCLNELRRAAYGTPAPFGATGRGARMIEEYEWRGGRPVAPNGCRHSRPRDLRDEG